MSQHKTTRHENVHIKNQHVVRATDRIKVCQPPQTTAIYQTACMEQPWTHARRVSSTESTLTQANNRTFHPFGCQILRN